MAALARQGADEGLWLRAERQTAGRGRLGRIWSSPPANLFASTLVRLRPADPPPATLALVAAVALEEVASAYAGRAVTLKWPNDLLADGAKLAGILLERASDAVVIGFGVNLAFHPEDVGQPATSIMALAGTAPAASSFLTDLVVSLSRWLARWRGEGLGPVRSRWLARAHPLGAALSVAIGGDRIDGLFEGLDEGGALRLRLADGTVHVIHAGDVFLI